jgi:hypothetical protein
MPAIEIAAHKNNKDRPLEVFSLFRSRSPSKLNGALAPAVNPRNSDFCTG